MVLDDLGDLLLLEDGAMPRSPFVVFLHGYAEDTGRTITLNVGRSGREAKVYKVKDRDTYDDDQASHMAKVREERANYRGMMARYRTAKRAYPKKLKAYKRRKKKFDDDLVASIAKVRAAIVRAFGRATGNK